MKKYLLLLLLATSFSYGQTTLANKLKITGNLTDNIATKVNVQATDGTVNTISKVELQDAFYYASASNFPVTGITDKLYIARDNNILYRFNGTIYVPLSADISGKEDIANKSSSFTASSTVTYANTKALVDGLATKQATISGTTNVIPKFGSGGLVGSSIFDNGNVGIGQQPVNNRLTVDKSGQEINSVLASGALSLSYSEGSTLVVEAGVSIFNQAYIQSRDLLNNTSKYPLRLNPVGGNIIVGTATDNSQGNLQVNGNITASPATLSNQVVVKSQLDLKADLASPTLTGTPTAPTATVGTNTTQLATTAYVLANAQSIPQLESNATDLTVWNNGKGNFATNTSFGDGALKSNTTNGANTAIGNEALFNNTSGIQNTALGQSSLRNTSSGGANTAVGISALLNNTIGNSNTAIGSDAGNSSGLTNSNSSIFIGSLSVPASNNQTNQIVIGVNTTGAGSNTATLGNTSITSTILRGTVSAGNATASNHLVTMSQVAQQLKDFFTDVNNVGITETDLFSYTTLANRLNITGEKLVANYGGSFNDATASSQIKVLFGGQVIGDTGALTMSVTGAWVTTVSIIRTGATTARAIVNITTPSASTAAYTKYTSLTGLTFTGTNIIKITGTASGATGGDNDITATYGNIIWQPAAL